MPQKKLLLSVLLWAALPAVGAYGAPLKLVGFDDMSCRAWAQSKDDAEQRALYVAWIRGVLTGHNYANQSQQVAAVSSGTVAQYVDRYCADKPAGQFSDAALRLSDQFSGRNGPIAK